MYMFDISKLCIHKAKYDSYESEIYVDYKSSQIKPTGYENISR